MRVLLAEVDTPNRWSNVHEFRDLAARDARGRHVLTADPSDADIILFTACSHFPGDWRLAEIARSPVARRFPEKTFIFDERDQPWCRFPGVYVNMPASGFDQRWQRAWAYHDTRLVPDVAPDRVEPDLLFSFVGSATHRARLRLFDIEHPRGLVRRSDPSLFVDAGSRDAAGVEFYAQTLHRSRFVLCPRGYGTASVRLFETMRAGRVPVIISDGWVRPRGPDWRSFSLSWPENRIDGLVGELERREGDAAEMGARARRAYEQWFAPEVAFDRIVGQLEELLPLRDSFPPRGRWDSYTARLLARRSLGRARAQMRHVRTGTGSTEATTD